MIQTLTRRLYAASPILKETADWAEGHYAVGALPADLRSPARWIALGPATGPRVRGLRVLPIGIGYADNATYELRPWFLRSVRPPAEPDNRVTEVLLEPATSATLTVTLGTAVGGAGGVALPAGARLADTIDAPAAAARFAAFLSAWGGESPAVHSPGDNTWAELYLPDCGNADYVAFEFSATGATANTGGNLVVEALS